MPPLCILPPELLLIVFGAACDDDGTTARSLVLVSRSFHFLALPFIYRVLALHGNNQLATLLERFKHEPGFASLVEHVLVAESGPGPECLAFENALRTLWEFVASTVKTLALSVHSRDEGAQKVFQTLFDASFPCLTDLTLCGEHPIPASASLRLPALRRFHTAGLTKRNPASCFTPLTVACPLLSHIRVSMGSERNITHAVSAAFGLPGARTDSEQMCLDRVPIPGESEREGTFVPFPIFPRELVSLVVKPTAPPVPLFAGHTSQFYRQYLNQLEELVPACPPGKMKLLPAFKRAMWDVEIYDAAEMRRNWIDAVRGGLGAWA
ncbi:unnamed protein product [Rhizoctonia solani]|uniref:F-box domain-containing protein n=1 Tax=Rhizoctonia solani TaxID=456999 RepID=A0A8H3DXS2_9AGAM|nr:unnamed protein product [Rhizoctonia solani]CAE7099478.1 unnamed protein product [Rhizoctonia solani]